MKKEGLVDGILSRLKRRTKIKNPKEKKNKSKMFAKRGPKNLKRGLSKIFPKNPPLLGLRLSEKAEKLREIKRKERKRGKEIFLY